MIPSDGGPIYTETVNHLASQSAHWLVEPWNAASAMLFLIVAGVWAWRLRGRFGEHRFITYGLIVLTIGGLGGTLYHALRTERLYLLMDWMPIVILAISVEFWFLFRLLRTKWFAFIYVVGGFGLIMIGFRLLVSLVSIRGLAAAVAYSLLAAQAFGPILWFLVRTRFKESIWVWLALLSFGLAVVFRTVDRDDLLPMGTHFLWHGFGAVMAYMLITYLWRIKRNGILLSPQSRHSLPENR